MKIYLKTYGCTYNQADSDTIAHLLQSRGHQLTSEQDADVVVVNTCAVKNATEQKEIYYLARLKKPVIATGCLAQATPEKIQSANGRAGVVGTFAQGRIVEAVESAFLGRQPIRFLDRSPALQNAAVTCGVVGRLKISKGCLSACTFCQTKLARGHLESFSVGELRRLARELLRNDAVELQLTSQDCGCYGFDNGENVALLLNSLSSLEGNFRIRLGMGNPEHFKSFFPSLLDAMESEKVYKFLHIPIQSGSNTVLADMKRSYKAEDFEKLVFSFLERFPAGTVATDVIVGYPTESEDDFQQTLTLLEKTRPDIVNLSKYSARPKTLAARLPQLPDAVIKRRSEIAAATCQRIAIENQSRFVGQVFNALAVEKNAKEHILCRSDAYRPVVLSKAVLGQIYSVRIVSSGRGFLQGLSESPFAEPISLNRDSRKG